MLLLAWTLANPVSATAQPPSDSAVKAAYLYKLRNYVEWPVASTLADGRTVIGVFGADDVAGHLHNMPAMREGAKRGMNMRKVKAGDNLAGITILFVGEDAWHHAGNLIAQARQQSTLVVSESQGALAGGSVINFRVVDERVRFEISLDSAEKSKLKLSSQLLALAIRVLRETRK